MNENNENNDQEVRKFTTGAIRDNDSTKEDYVETISYRALKRYAKYMTGKKSRYGSGNFKKGIPIESYEQSLMRHVQKYFENKYEDGVIETQEDHLSAILFNVFGIMHEEEGAKKMKDAMTIGLGIAATAPFSPVTRLNPNPLLTASTPGAGVAKETKSPTLRTGASESMAQMSG